MTDLGPVGWPPAPIHTDRPALRETEARDRPGVIELNASAEVRAHLGGPRPREGRSSSATCSCRRRGGTRTPARPAPRLDWIAGALPGEPVLLCTQTANLQERFDAWLERQQDQRVTWPAELDGETVGMLDVLASTRMPRPGRDVPSR